MSHALDDVLLPHWEDYSVTGVRCALAEPERWRNRWALQAKHLLWKMRSTTPEQTRYETFRAGVAGISLESLDSGEWLPTTRQRCELISQSIRQQHDCLEEILAPLEQAQTTASEFINYLERAPEIPHLWSGFDHVYRDWGWSTDENEHSKRLTLSLLDDRRVESLLVPGAGACRLAYELHEALRPNLTVATDIQPLITLIARRILTGSPVDLFEFPKYPANLDSYCVKRRLSAPRAVSSGFFQLLSDFSKPTFKPCAFDCIVTHWFIDLPRVPFYRLAALLNHYLADEGLWLNIGPTMFDPPVARMLSTDEILEFVALAGFEIENKCEHFTPYLVSPASSGRREERILGFCARKLATVGLPPESVEAQQITPQWLVHTDLPVSVASDIRPFVVTHKLVLEVLEGASRHMSVSQIAEQVSTRLGFPMDIAQTHVDSVLRSLSVRAEELRFVN